jgi:glutamine synthetase
MHPILDKLKKDGITKIKLGIFDVDGVFRGKYINMKKFTSAIDKDFGFCNVVFGWDLTDKLYDKPTVTGWHTGYPDAPAVIDVNSYRKIPWEPNTALFIADFQNPDGSPYPACPRQLCKTILQKAENLGFKVKSAFEYEFFLFNETPHSIREKKYENLTHFTPGMLGYSILRNSVHSELYHDFIDTCREMDFELEGIHTETGPGVLEACIAVDSGLAAADKAALFKTFAKVLAQRWELMATFMAKWSPDFPGQSGHLHQSLWNKDGSSAFYDESREHKMSAVFRHYLAGQIQLLPEVLPMIAPTINSYTRMIKGFWAPTHSNWGIDNRTCAIRVIPGSPKSHRLEYRIAAADGNPYLALAASIACGLYGIENKLELPPMVEGNAYDLDTSPQNVELPNSLEKSINVFSKSKIMRELFGDAWVDHFTLTREWEAKCYNEQKKENPDWFWMRDRYFEII